MATIKVICIENSNRPDLEIGRVYNFIEFDDDCYIENSSVFAKTRFRIINFNLYIKICGK